MANKFYFRSWGVSSNKFYFSGTRGSGAPGIRGPGRVREGPGAKLENVALFGWKQAIPTSESESSRETI